MGGHNISIKSIFDFRTSLPINEILYIQYINTYIHVQQINYLFSGNNIGDNTEFEYVFLLYKK